MSKDYTTVLIEAIVVGGLLLALFYTVKNIIPTYSEIVQLFITGAAFHILCEISGINLWYVKNYVEILNKNN
jgi:hypothetical protein